MVCLQNKFAILFQFSLNEREDNNSNNMKLNIINNNIMKKILLLAGIIAALPFVTSAATLSTNVTAGGTYLLSTNRASIYQIELTSANACAVNFYDSDNLAAPFFGTN